MQCKQRVHSHSHKRKFTLQMPMANLSCCFSQCSDLSHFNLYLYFQNEEVEEEEQEKGEGGEEWQTRVFCCLRRTPWAKKKEKKRIKLRILKTLNRYIVLLRVSALLPLRSLALPLSRSLSKFRIRHTHARKLSE